LSRTDELPCLVHPGPRERPRRATD
jgi:hypothetical protein